MRTIENYGMFSSADRHESTGWLELAGCDAHLDEEFTDCAESGSLNSLLHPHW